MRSTNLVEEPTSGVQARDVVELAVRREMFGPSDSDLFGGSGVDCSGASITLTPEQGKECVFHDKASGEELLTRTTPEQRYGIGVLFGNRGAQLRVTANQSASLPEVFTGLGDTERPTYELSEDLGSDEIGGTSLTGSADDDDFDLSDANGLKPSAMAISFRVKLNHNGRLRVRVEGARYQKFKVSSPTTSSQMTWWLRKPFTLIGEIHSTELMSSQRTGTSLVLTPITQSEEIDTGYHPVLPTVQVFSRPVPGEPSQNTRLVTIVMSNEHETEALFQCGFSVCGSENLEIEPYSNSRTPGRDDEEQTLRLLYRKKLTFAVGHGCAASWGENELGQFHVKTEALPSYDTVSLTPNIYHKRSDGTFERDSFGKRRAVTVSMADLADETLEGKEQIEVVLRLYGEWIDGLRSQIPELIEDLQVAAAKQIDLCAHALARMRAGWQLVQEDANAKRAFALTNQAMLYQQLRSRLPDRVVRMKGQQQTVEGPHPEVVPSKEAGHWRPFQIAFILATLPEIINGESSDRALVDLIFFPTGGGKTEAYLGAASMSLLSRRLRNPSDTGTDILMRYTLRLLTAQQFLRAAALICVLEDIRSRDVGSLGDSRFGIGIWLGGASTPNTRDSALASYKRMLKDSRAENMFLLSRCPWCGTRVGRTSGNGKLTIAGYIAQKDRVVFRCPDPKCRFGGRRETLPVYVVDEDIYEQKPSLVIGTVDKFAMTAWNTAPAALFGLDEAGARVSSPPNLIIQDELHLISGPLGSMVGLYEPLIEALCTDYRSEPPIVPKIIASTATIRRYEEQSLGVFGRNRTRLFPPQGLEEGHSFFAEPGTDENGNASPGRRYVGIMSGSLGSMQTVQVRVAAATLSGAQKIPEGEARDGYWTNLNFMNSLRELGNTKHLLDSDIPDYLTGMKIRDGLEQQRWPRRVLELTSRRRSDEIPEAIDTLSKRYGENGCIDVCLASNIIEVGVDIDRLGLMTVVGQPKTTAQYIQVSGRVGRKAAVAPGLVFTLYGATKPRDRSHYERFMTYHQQLYAQVEPTSVTPFATPVLRRALHAVMIAYVRQTSPELKPFPFPAKEIEAFADILRARVKLVSPEQLGAFESVLDERKREWKTWQRTEWSANVNGGNPTQGLMRYAGTLPNLNSQSTTWDVPMSMRNVDAECAIEISHAYLHDDSNLEGDLP